MPAVLAATRASNSAIHTQDDVVFFATIGGGRLIGECERLVVGSSFDVNTDETVGSLRWVTMAVLSSPIEYDFLKNLIIMRAISRDIQRGQSIYIESS